MFDFSYTKTELLSAGDTAAISLSVNCDMPDFCKELISIEPATLEPGNCFHVSGSAAGVFSFTDESSSIIETLCLTIRSSLNYFHWSVKRNVTALCKRVKNVVRSTAPRFLRL